MFTSAGTTHHGRMTLLDATGRDLWRLAAACKNHPGANFYPETEAEARPAKRICAACPVRRPCLDMALWNGERYGVWGGLTERERLRLGRRRAA